ncbi:hypothetical protein M409DRAFT_58273 [Zasmidium cellare ATCC 36951]|uniref:Uncharacterized protein n=1 Tax=Zasmidium cellare ATCC 36951 TaxID=1080233 RepID=A0A6A6C9F3_ZASCE|nr:uncharacterized protein M409DRAFT_58273 [Zasmidium cellare ATCC 36951]KAF2162522.1 hypothetical protein M409DRAFT_58273 [Zasmidium cellare ATCC 36951]
MRPGTVAIPQTAKRAPVKNRINDQAANSKNPRWSPWARKNKGLGESESGRAYPRVSRHLTVQLLYTGVQTSQPKPARPARFPLSARPARRPPIRRPPPNVTHYCFVQRQTCLEAERAEYRYNGNEMGTRDCDPARRASPPPLVSEELPQQNEFVL